jgi:hypothetical protein
MSTYRALLALLFIGIASNALGQAKVPTPEPNVPAPEMGTPEQRAACGPDVGRFCKSVKPEDGPFAYRACPFRKSHPHILMMESGQNGDGDDLPIPLDCSTQGCIFL